MIKPKASQGAFEQSGEKKLRGSTAGDLEQLPGKKTSQWEEAQREKEEINEETEIKVARVTHRPE